MDFRLATQIKAAAVNRFFSLVEGGAPSLQSINGAPMKWVTSNLAGFGVGCDSNGEWHPRAYVQIDVPDSIQGILEEQIPKWKNMQIVKSGMFRTVGAAAAVASGTTPSAPLSRTTPLPVGATIGLAGAGVTGTLGAFVRDEADEFLLTCHHVLNVDLTAATMPNGSLPPRTVVEKPTNSSDLPAGTLAQVSPFLATSAPEGDWALAKLNTQIDPALPGGLGCLKPHPLSPAGNMRVIRASGPNPRGRIFDVSADLRIQTSQFGRLAFKNQIIIQGANNSMFADDGDSGSLVVKSGPSPRGAVGMVFAKNVDPSGAPANLKLTAAMPLVSFFQQHSLWFITRVPSC